MKGNLKWRQQIISNTTTNWAITRRSSTEDLCLNGKDPQWREFYIEDERITSNTMTDWAITRSHKEDVTAEDLCINGKDPQCTEF